MQEEEPHFLLTVLGMLQLSKYLCEKSLDKWDGERENVATKITSFLCTNLMMLSRQLICW